MSDPLLNVMKVMLLAALYLFFVRVLLTVYAELRDPAGRKLPTAARPGKRRAAARAAASAPAAHSAASGAGHQPQTARPAPPATSLVVVDPPEQAGRRWMLGDTATIGRSGSCDVAIDDTYVSSVHARLFQRGGQYFLEDLDSRNGTLLNGEIVEATIAVRVGDQLRFGGTTMELT